MPRFFAKPENISDTGITIVGDDAYHIARALRMATGDEISICDGELNEYVCRLVKIRDDECECTILSKLSSRSESPLDLTLFMAFPKSDKLELVVQKAVELGASRIVPFESSRCIKRQKAEKAEKQTARLSRIAEEAAKQCGRAKIPTVEQSVSFEKMLDEASRCELSLFCYEGEGTLSLKSVLESRKDVHSISVVVGSEGGFSPKEAQDAISKGLIPVNLGPRILRCETAPMYALSAISFFFEL